MHQGYIWCHAAATPGVEVETDRSQRELIRDGACAWQGGDDAGSPIGKEQLLDLLCAARAEWDAALARIPLGWMIEPGVEGEWSVKDIVAHSTWGEREAIGVAQARALVGSELWQLPQDERNRAVFEQNRHRDLSDVLADSVDVFARFVAALEPLSQDDLNDPDRFVGLPTGWRPWRILYDPGHYAAHLRSIRTWWRGHAPEMEP
jgi:hypothetical protein